MRDAAFEHGRLGEVFIHMDCIDVRGHAGKHDEVCISNGFGDFCARADRQIFDVVTVLGIH